MKPAYIDTSVVLAVALREKGWESVARRLAKHQKLLSSSFLEAELKAAFKREEILWRTDVTAVIAWVIPDRLLSGEIDRVLEQGYVRGADCWHLATALYLFPEPDSAAFVTLDIPQRRIASALGFAV